MLGRSFPFTGVQRIAATSHKVKGESWWYTFFFFQFLTSPKKYTGRLKQFPLNQKRSLFNTLATLTIVAPFKAV